MSIIVLFYQTDYAFYSSVVQENIARIDWLRLDVTAWYTKMNDKINNKRD